MTWCKNIKGTGLNDRKIPDTQQKKNTRNILRQYKEKRLFGMSMPQSSLLEEIKQDIKYCITRRHMYSYCISEIFTVKVSL